MQSAFTPAGKRRLQNIVLFAEPGMRECFAEITRWLPPQSVIDKIFMTPLTEKQTMDYLRHRLKTAGMLRKNPFSSDQMRRIHQLSRGLPGWINGEAFILLKKMNRHRKGFKRSLIGPFFQVFYRQIGWMDRLSCFFKKLTADDFCRSMTIYRLLR